MSKETAASGRQSRCPVCGLSLQAHARGQALELTYDFAAWDRHCKNRGLGGPSMCLTALRPAAAVVDGAIGGCDDPVQETPFGKARL